ncbi:MAG: hypothetical protein ACI861_001402, partial [Paracoccaceae bacterium]
ARAMSSIDVFLNPYWAKTVRISLTVLRSLI